MEKITVKIDEQDSNLVERLFYEHASGKDNVAFLMKDKDINENVLLRYIDVVDIRFYELEKAKTLLSKKYEPKELNGKAYDYSFDFENETLTYIPVQ